MARLVDRYILRELVPPFLIGLLLVTFVLLMNQALLLADLFIDKGVPFALALRLLALLVPSLLAFALPMAVLMGILGGLARLSADSEIVALRSVGVGPARLARPVLLFGLAGFLAALPLALVLGPRSNAAWARAMTGSVLARVRLEVEPLRLNDTLPGIVFFVRHAARDGTWSDVFAYLADDPAHPRLIMARSGRLELFPESRRAVLRLADGRVHGWSREAPETDTVTSFERLEQEVGVEGLFAAGSAGKGVREKDIGELVRDLRGLRARAPGLASPRQLRAHGVEIHKKLALPAACLVFAVLGLPLGLAAGRTGRTGGFSIGLAVVLVYYALLTAGEKAAMDGRLPPALAMWAPDILLAAAGALLASTASGAAAKFRRRPASRPAAGPRPAPVPSPASRRSVRPAPFRFPGLLDRYVGRKFLALLALLLAALSAAAFVAAFLEHLGDALERGKPVGLVARQAWFRLPDGLAFLLPVAVLAAAVLALGLLARSGEATAMKASGVSAYRTALPVLILSAAACGAAFLVQERIAPAAHARAEAALGAIRDLPARSYSFRGRHWVLGRDGERVYHYDHFDPSSAAFGRLSVFELDPERWALSRRVFAGKATFEEDALVYGRALVRDYSEAGPAFARTESGRLAAAADRGAFLTPWREPAQMTRAELRDYAAEVRASGFDDVRLRAALARRTALPFVSLVMALLAVPFGLRAGKRGALVGLGFSAAVAMTYWGAFAAFRGLGAAGVLTPFLGAWGASLIFGLAGTVGLSRLRT